MLNKEDKRGLKYLRLSIAHLKQYFNKNYEIINEFDEIMDMINSYDRYSNSYQFTYFTNLSKAIIEKDDMKNLITELKLFQNINELSWTKYIKTKRFKLPPFSQTIALIGIIMTIFSNLKTIQIIDSKNIFQILGPYLFSIFDIYDYTFFIIILLFAFWAGWVKENKIDDTIIVEYVSGVNEKY